MRFRFPWLIILFALAAFVLSTVEGCAPIPATTPSPDSTAPVAIQTPNATQAARPRVVRINLGTRPDLLDPQRASSNSEIAILQLAYEGLTRWDSKGRVVPGAADRWEFGNEGKTLTFHLRAGLKRADGAPITAKDFEFAFKRALDPRLGGVDASFLDDVTGATAAYTLDPKSRPDDIQRALDAVGVQAVDDATLVFSFVRPAGYFPTLAATWLGYPTEKTKIESDPDAWWFKPENHNSNGLFLIKENQDQFLKLVPNPNYWGGKPKLDRIEFSWITDATAALGAYRQGNLEVLRLSSDDLAVAQADAALAKEIIRAPTARVSYLGFNVKRAPFTDKNVRKAFSLALDRDAFVRDALKNFGKPYLSWIPPGIAGYDAQATVPAFDANQAIQTLVEGGYGTADRKKVDCNKLGAIKLTYSNTPRNQFLYQFIAGSFAKTLACPILIDPIDPATFPVVARDPRTAPQIFLLTWEQEYPHPQNWLFLHACNGTYAQRIGYCNREFDAALALANAETDFEAAAEKYRAAQKILVGDGVAAFFWENENAFLVKPYVIGLRDALSVSDTAFPGQFGALASFSIDPTKTGAGYPGK
ncbi:MAG: peptide ABC transporter substrate-binding protein [Chloroflexi bacterium]|nr:peptide ABC transporter substrate-binding protein [Chloroflexota bacterium]